MAPGRPPLAHQGAGGVAQPHGGNGSFAIDPVQLGLARGGGKPLPQAVLAKMEAAFGADFSAVRIHVGPQASRIGAIAFTTGNDLYFAPGRYQPDSVQGQQLIGHELAHVIQQRQGRVRASGNGVSVVQDRALEAEADRLGVRAASCQLRQAAPGIPPRPPSPQTRPRAAQAAMEQSFVPYLTTAALGALGALGYIGYRAYQYLGHTAPETGPLAPVLGRLAEHDGTRHPPLPNLQHNAYPNELNNHLNARGDTRNDPAAVQIFQEDYTFRSAERFRTRVRSGVRFLWALRTDGILGICSTTSSQHSIAASNNPVIAAGEGQLQRAIDIPATVNHLEILENRTKARTNRLRIEKKLRATLNNQPDPCPGLTIEVLEENAQVSDQNADDLEELGAGAAAIPVWRDAGDDIVYLNLHSGHYTPRLSYGRAAPRGPMPQAFEAWRKAGFKPMLQPGSQFV
jgi:hypothetical protein